MTSTEPTIEPIPAHDTSGWVVFAATVTFFLAAANLLYGITLLAGDDWIVITPEQLVRFNSTAVGTIYLLFGVFQLAVGFAILRGAFWSRLVGIAGAGLNALAQMAFLSAYPTWSLIIMVVDLLVIYALAVHGDEVTAR
jgi:hypothetical protein